MTWSLYRWVWQLEAPLHIGMPPAGILNRTRLYVPVRAIWGALTAEIARCRSCGSSDPNAIPGYHQIGQYLCEHARFSNLFPAEKVDAEWRAWLPEYRDGKGMVWIREDGKCLDDRTFRTCLLDTRPGTAIAPDSDTAAEGTLRETECVQPFWRKPCYNTFDSVAMVGYVVCKDDSKELLKSIDKIFVGGDTRYGLGKMQRVEWLEAGPNFFGNEVDLTSDEPQVETNRLLAHACINDLVEGAFELLVGWNDQNLEKIGEKPLWVPGSRLKHKTWWIIKENGTWQHVSARE